MLEYGNEFNFNEKDLKNLINKFIKLRQENDILKNNTGGMSFNHQFMLFYCLTLLKPKYVIESGVWRGATTLIIEKCLPDVKLFCIDLFMPKTAHPQGLCYESKKAKYITNSKNNKFIDFSEYDWSIIPLEERENTFILFDDHQDHYKRIKQSIKKKFNKSYIFFDDNWITGTGDCYTLKKIFDINCNHHGLIDKCLLEHKDNFNKQSKNINLEEHKNNYNEVLKLISFYKELQPMILFYDDLIKSINIKNKDSHITKEILIKNTQLPLFKSIENLNEYLGYEINNNYFYIKKIKQYELDSYLGINDNVECKSKHFNYSFPCLIRLK